MHELGLLVAREHLLHGLLGKFRCGVRSLPARGLAFLVFGRRRLGGLNLVFSGGVVAFIRSAVFLAAVDVDCSCGQMLRLGELA